MRWVNGRNGICTSSVCGNRHSRVCSTPMYYSNWISIVLRWPRRFAFQSNTGPWIDTRNSNALISSLPHSIPSISYTWSDNSVKCKHSIIIAFQKSLSLEMLLCSYSSWNAYFCATKVWARFDSIIIFFSLFFFWSLKTSSTTTTVLKNLCGSSHFDFLHLRSAAISDNFCFVLFENTARE